MYRNSRARIGHAQDGNIKRACLIHNRLQQTLKSASTGRPAHRSSGRRCRVHAATSSPPATAKHATPAGSTSARLARVGAVTPTLASPAAPCEQAAAGGCPERAPSHAACCAGCGCCTALSHTETVPAASTASSCPSALPQSSAVPAHAWHARSRPACARGILSASRGR